MKVIDNWRVIDGKLVVTTKADIIGSDQIFEEGSIVEVSTDSMIKLGKPAKSRLYTYRLINIFKMVLEDMDKSNTSDIFAYTARNEVPNITRHDVEKMIEELTP